MDDVKLTPGDIALALLQIFPPTICETILDEEAFRTRYGLHRNANIRFDPSGIKLDRSKLFAAIRSLFDTPSVSTELADESGETWRLEFDDKRDRHVVLVRESKRVGLPDLRCLSPDSAERAKWFEGEAKRLRLDAQTIDGWSEKLRAQPIADEDVDALLNELRLTPLYVSGELAGHLQCEIVNTGTLVPADARYYERLVGFYDAMALRDYLLASGRDHIGRLLDDRPFEGLQLALLMSSHGLVAQTVDLKKVEREDVRRLFQWLEKNGDPLSQVGGIELGLLHLEKYPELEPHISEMTRTLLADDAEHKDGRLGLLSTLIVLVDGELARIGVLRTKPPYWRRLAAIAQAALIQRTMMAVGTPPDTFHDWAMKGRGQVFYLQTLADLRTEPRWMPDFVSPSQLKAEFIGRISSAAHASKAKIRSAELKKLLLAKDPEASSRK